MKHFIVLELVWWWGLLLIERLMILCGFGSCLIYESTNEPPATASLPLVIAQLQHFQGQSLLISLIQKKVCMCCSECGRKGVKGVSKWERIETSVWQTVAIGDAFGVQVDNSSRATAAKRNKSAQPHSAYSFSCTAAEKDLLERSLRWPPPPPQSASPLSSAAHNEPIRAD